MGTRSSDNLSKALMMLKQTTRNPQSASASRRAGQPDIGELFLAELRIRRARLRKWIEMLNQEVDGLPELRMEPATVRMAPRACRGRYRQAYTAR